MTFIKTDVSGAIATHAAVTTNVHGTGAGNFTKQASGNYTGNGSQNRAIAHGFGITPKLIITNETSTASFVITISLGTNCLSFIADHQVIKPSIAAADATNFYVGAVSGGSSNINGETYSWVAFI